MLVFSFTAKIIFFCYFCGKIKKECHDEEIFVNHFVFNRCFGADVGADAGGFLQHQVESQQR